MTQDNLKKHRLAIIWPGYRKNNQHFFELLSQNRLLDINVLWIRDFRRDDEPPAQLLSSIKWNVVGARNIRISDYTVKTFARMVRAVYSAIRHSDGVLTSTQAPIHSKIAFVITRILRKKIFIVTEQWADFGRNSFLMRQYKRLDRYLMRNREMLFLHGKNQQDYALSKGVCRDRIRILPFLSDDLAELPLKQPRLREELGLNGKKVVLYFGRITPQKGLRDLILAFSRIQNRVNKAILLVCGGADKYFSDFSRAIVYEKECRLLARLCYLLRSFSLD